MRRSAHVAVSLLGTCKGAGVCMHACCAMAACSLPGHQLRLPFFKMMLAFAALLCTVIAVHGVELQLQLQHQSMPQGTAANSESLQQWSGLLWYAGVACSTCDVQSGVAWQTAPDHRGLVGSPDTDLRAGCLNILCRIAGHRCLETDIAGVLGALCCGTLGAQNSASAPLLQTA